MKRFLRTEPGLFAILPIRLAVGLIMAGHGAQKMLGWFGGMGFKETANAFEKVMGSPGTLWAVLAGGGELVGGICLFIGLFTRPAAAIIGAIMTVAIVKVHNKSFFLSDSGMEYCVALLAMSATLFWTGGGALSADSMIAGKAKDA